MSQRLPAGSGGGAPYEAGRLWPHRHDQLGCGVASQLTGIQAYTAAKHALVGLTKQFTQEFARHGITANSVAPGFVLSNPTSQRQWESYDPEGQRRMVERIHTRRLGRAEDIAAAVAFFASEAAEWTTGQILSVDGCT